MRRKFYKISCLMANEEHSLCLSILPFFDMEAKSNENQVFYKELVIEHFYKCFLKYFHCCGCFHRN